MKTFIRIWLICSFVFCLNAFAQTDITGTWRGKLAVGPDESIAVRFIITKLDDGTYKVVLDSPGAGAVKNVPATSATFSGNVLTVEVKSLNGSYTGTLDKGIFTGEWHQPGGALPLVLTLQTKLSPKDVEWNFNKPQPEWKTVTPRPFPAGIRPARVSQANDALHITLGPSNANPNGVLVGGAFVNVPGLDHREWSHVVIKARSSGQGNMQLGFNIWKREGHPNEGWPFPYEMDGTQGAPLVGDGTVQTYQLPLAPSGPWEDLIRQLGLWFLADKPLEIEILSIAVVPKPR